MPSRSEDAEIESELALSDVIDQALHIENQELREREVESIASMLSVEQGLPFDDEGLTASDIEVIETLSAWGI
jgi:predicted transcriptional regulator